MLRNAVRDPSEVIEPKTGVEDVDYKFFSQLLPRFHVEGALILGASVKLCTSLMKVTESAIALITAIPLSRCRKHANLGY